MLYETKNECFSSSDGTDIFMRWKMKCSIQRSKGSLISILKQNTRFQFMKHAIIHKFLKYFLSINKYVHRQ